MKKNIAIISFSKNSDFQEIVLAIQQKSKNIKSDNFVYSITDMKNKANSKYENENLFINCPLVPGISLSTFNFVNLMKIVRFIKNKKITHLYFYSSHVWNIFLMVFLGKKYYFYHSVHDVIPHEKIKMKT